LRKGTQTFVPLLCGYAHPQKHKWWKFFSSINLLLILCLVLKCCHQYMDFIRSIERNCHCASGCQGWLNVMGQVALQTW